MTKTQPQTIIVAGDAANEPVVYIERDKVAAAFVNGGLFAEGSHYRVQAARRDGEPGNAELHSVEDDIFYVLEGTATFITGGMIVESRQTAVNEVRGKAIEGGTTHQLQKGDLIVIPSNTPHWF